MPAVTRTTNFKFPKPAFGQTPWQSYYEELVNSLDSLLGRFLGTSGFTGVWANSTVFAVGDIAIDATTNVVYENLVAHTSAASGTFATDRTLHPSYWQLWSGTLSTILTTNTFTPGNSQTWNKNSRAKLILVRLWGGGGGGGGGAGGSAGAVRQGGTGAGGGAFNEFIYLASDLSSIETVNVGAGGGGGVGGSAGLGADGESGGNSDFGSKLYAYGGGGGNGGSSGNNKPGGSGGGVMSAGLVGAGTTSVDGGHPRVLDSTGTPTYGTTGGGGAASFANDQGYPSEWGGGSGGGVPTGGGAATRAGGCSTRGGGGGGAGGSLDTANVERVGQEGGNNKTSVSDGSGGGGTGGAVNGGAGSAGADGGTLNGGQGGGGGGSQDSGTGGIGGVGGLGGGAGGGGGGGTTVGGAGGRGGNGRCVVYQLG